MNPSPLRKPLLVHLTGRFRATLAQINATSAPKVRALWARLPDYNDADIAEFERRATPIIVAAKTATVRSAAGFYSLAAGIRPHPITAKDVDVVADTRGPFIQTWSALKHGDTRDGAIAAGASRAEAMITNLVSSASRQTGNVLFDRASIDVGWERDPEPDACDWCLEAASTLYSSAEATDFGHDRCMCLGVPAF